MLHADKNRFFDQDKSCYKTNTSVCKCKVKTNLFNCNFALAVEGLLHVYYKNLQIKWIIYKL